MNIKPSPCRLASTETSIEDALNTIEATKTSYLLLVDENERLAGIVTKTDILRSVKFLKTDPGYFDRPLRQIMNHPVQSLSIDLMHTAPEFMLKHGIEHVPITEVHGESEKEPVVGVITSEAVFEFMVKMRGLPPIFGGASALKHRRTVGVLCSDGSLFRLLHGIFKDSGSIDVIRYKFGGFDLRKTAQNIDALVMDLDDVADRIWLPIIKDAVTEEQPENVFVSYTPEKHQNADKALHQLEIKGLLEVYSKPLDLTQITCDLEKAWTEEG